MHTQRRLEHRGLIRHQMEHLHDFVLRLKVQFRVKTGPSGFYGLESSTHIAGNPHHQEI